MAFLAFFLADGLGGSGDSGISERSIQAYAQQVARLFPPGRALLLEPGSQLWKFCEVLGMQPLRVAIRVQDLIRESDPNQTSELISDWESNLGLPDSCLVEIPATLAGRQAAVSGKYLASGGQSPAYFIQIAASFGYTVTITRSLANLVMRAGFRSGDRCYGTDWAFAGVVTTSAIAADAISKPEFECEILKLWPAHGIPTFVYP